MQLADDGPIGFERRDHVGWRRRVARLDQQRLQLLQGRQGPREQAVLRRPLPIALHRPPVRPRRPRHRAVALRRPQMAYQLPYIHQIFSPPGHSSSWQHNSRIARRIRQ